MFIRTLHAMKVIKSFDKTSYGILVLKIFETCTEIEIAEFYGSVVVLFAK